MGYENGTTQPAYQVKTSDELGRYITAARDLNPGDVVLTERPIVFGPKSMLDPEASMPCVGCYTPVVAEVGERCAKCGWPVCSGNCPGLKDPRHHGIECDILSARPECVLENMPEYYRHDALLPLRCVLLQTTDPESWKKVLEMQSHMESRTPGTQAYEEANEFVVEYLMNNFINKLDANLKSKYLPEISSELLHQMCGIIDTNALEIRLPESAELFALYAKTYLVEHSCLPNTKHIFNVSSKDRTELYTILMKAVVPIQKDGHITTMYSHALWGTPARRQHLQDTKYFSCKCIRCSDPTELGTYLSAAKCLGQDGNPCDGIHLPEDPLDDETDWACNKCPAKVNSNEINMVIFQMGEEVETIQMMGGSIEMLENLLSKLSMFLHPNHYHLYAVKHSLVQLYGRQPGLTSEDVLDKKIKMCRDLIGITNILDPGNARLSLYTSVLQHELHSALVMKAILKKGDGSSKSIEEMRPLLAEAKSAIDVALEALKDDVQEISGMKLYSVIEETKVCFENLCKENNLPL